MDESRRRWQDRIATLELEVESHRGPTTARRSAALAALGELSHPQLLNLGLWATYLVRPFLLAGGERTALGLVWLEAAGEARRVDGCLAGYDGLELAQSHALQAAMCIYEASRRTGCGSSAGTVVVAVNEVCMALASEWWFPLVRDGRAPGGSKAFFASEEWSLTYRGVWGSVCQRLRTLDPEGAR